MQRTKKKVQQSKPNHLAARWLPGWLPGDSTGACVRELREGPLSAPQAVSRRRAPRPLRARRSLRAQPPWEERRLGTLPSSRSTGRRRLRRRKDSCLPSPSPSPWERQDPGGGTKANPDPGGGPRSGGGGRRGGPDRPTSPFCSREVGVRAVPDRPRPSPGGPSQVPAAGLLSGNGGPGAAARVGLVPAGPASAGAEGLAESSGESGPAARRNLRGAGAGVRSGGQRCVAGAVWVSSAGPAPLPSVPGSTASTSLSPGKEKATVNRNREAS